MDSAIIPPIPHLGEAVGREFHLILAHMVESSPEYSDFYVNEANSGSFIILDNSAHENTHGQPIQNLLHLAEIVHAKEIVIPDKLFDWEETALGASESFAYLRGFMDDFPSPYRWMFVPQGNDIREWVNCLEQILDLVDESLRSFPNLLAQGFTLGLSKDFEVWEGGLFRLLQDHLIPARRKYQGYKCEIHLLGWGRDLWALRGINQVFGSEIRSIDSAKPFVYGISNIKLDPYTRKIPPYPKRPPDYFQYHLNLDQLYSARSNVRVFDNLAHTGTFM